MEIFKRTFIKRIITLSLCFILTFTLCLKPKQDVYAFDLVVTPTLMYYVVGTYLLASGIVIANENDLWNIAIQGANALKEETQETISKVIEFKPNPNSPNGIGRFKLGVLGTAWIGDFVEGIKSIKDVVLSELYKPINSGSVGYKEYTFNLSLGNLPSLSFPNGARTWHDGIIGSSNAKYVTDSTLVSTTKEGSQYRILVHAKLNGVIVPYVEYYLNPSSIATIRVYDGAVVVLPPDDVLKDYVKPSEIPDYSIPYVPGTGEFPGLSVDKLPGSSFDDIKDLVTDPDPNPDPDPDPNPDPEQPPKGFFGKILDFIGSFFQTLFDGLTNILNGLFKGISTLIQTIIDWIAELFPWLGQILQAIYDVLANIFAWLGEFFQNIGQAIENVLNKFFKPLPETEPTLNPDGLIDGLNPTFTNPLIKSFDKLKDMDTTKGEPPKIMFNLYQLVLAATQNFGDVDIPFADEDRVLFDFATLNNYQFMGMGFMDLTRNMIGFGFIWWTALYILRKFSPDSVIS